MRKLKTSLFTHLVWLLLLSSQCLLAQEITVLDSSSNKPIEHANVVFFEQNSNTILQQLTTDKNGVFKAQIDPKAVIYLSVTVIGYKKYTHLFEPTQRQIRLAPNITLLKGVKVNRKILEFKSNTMLFDISQIPHLDYLNTAEVLDQLPFIRVEDTQVKMMNESVNILINGRHHMLYSTIDGLKSLPPHAISKVELVLTPTARSGGSKTLNITLKKDYLLGMNGSIQTVLSPATVSQMMVLSYWKKKYGFDASINYSYASNWRKSDTHIEYFSNGNQLQSHIRTDSKSIRGGVNFSSFYNIDSLSTLDFQFSLSPSRTNSLQNSAITTSQLAMADMLQSGILNQGNSNLGTSMSLNYTKKLRKVGNAFYLLSNFSNSRTSLDYALQDMNTINGNILRTEDFISKGRTQEGTVEAIWQQNASKVFRYTLGSKIINRFNKNDYWIDQNGKEVYTPYQMNQVVSSSYVDVDWTLKKLTTHIGSRLDYNHNQFKLPKELVQEALNFTPNISFTYNINPINTLMLTYSRSLIRPGSYQFVPVATSVNSYIQETGSTELRNQITNNWGMQYYGNFKKARLALDFRYTNTSGLLREFSMVGEDNIILIIPINVTSNESYTLGSGLDFQLLKKIRVSHYNNVSYGIQRIDTEQRAFIMSYLNDRISYELNKNSQLSMNFRAFSPNVTPQGREQTMAYLNFGIQYGRYFKIGNNTATLGVSLSNPNLYAGYKSFFYLNSPDLTQRTDVRSRNTIIGANFRIMFKGKNYGSRTFYKQKSIQNNDLNSKEE